MQPDQTTTRSDFQELDKTIAEVGSLVSDPSFCLESLYEIRQTLRHKGEDYGTEKTLWDSFTKLDPLVPNERLGIWAIFLVFLGTKLIRLRNLLRDEAFQLLILSPDRKRVHYESINDTILDFAGYLILLHAYRKWQEKQHVDGTDQPNPSSK